MNYNQFINALHESNGAEIHVPTSLALEYLEEVSKSGSRLDVQVYVEGNKTTIVRLFPKLKGTPQ